MAIAIVEELWARIRAAIDDAVAAAGEAEAYAADTSSTLSTKADKKRIMIDPADFGATPLPDSSGAGADSTDALEAAIAHAQSLRDTAGGDVTRQIVINAWYKFSRDLTIDFDGFEMVGQGGETGLLGVNAGVVVGSTEQVVNRPALRNLRVRRVTTTGNEHGVALDISGGSSNAGPWPVRWALDHVEAESPVSPHGNAPEKSVAVRMRGTFLGTCNNLYARNAYYGLVIEGDGEAGTLSANSVAFFGGEIQAVQHIGRIDKAIGVSFFGMAWEGAALGGMDVNNTRGFTAVGMYHEKNKSYDMRFGEMGRCQGIHISGGISSVGGFWGTGEHEVNRSIILRDASAVDISGIHFLHYKSRPVVVDEKTAGMVTGQAAALSCTDPTVMGVEVKAGTRWGTTTAPAVAPAGGTTTLWSGTQSDYDALPESTRNAVGFVAVVV